ncbi:hypothetical protein BH23BAC3_BH23BAC3_03150 [soil metagenome]
MVTVVVFWVIKNSKYKFEYFIMTQLRLELSLWFISTLKSVKAGI